MTEKQAEEIIKQLGEIKSEIEVLKHLQGRLQNIESAVHNVNSEVLKNFRETLTIKNDLIPKIFNLIDKK